MSILLKPGSHVIVHLVLIACAFSPCTSGLSLKGDTYYDCKNPPAGSLKSLIKEFDGKNVTIGGASASDLECLGGGEDSVIFNGMSNGEKVIVKLLRHTQTHGLEYAAKLALLTKTGDAPVVSLISEGFTAERPAVYGEIWPKVAGSSFKQIGDSGGFKNPSDFFEFAKKSCEAIIRLWSAGIEHGDIHRGNLMWDGEKRAVTLIDYEDMDDLDTDEENIDVIKLANMMHRHREEIKNYGEDAVALIDDFKKHSAKYARSLGDFKKFYEDHFTRKFMRANRQ